MDSSWKNLSNSIFGHIFTFLGLKLTIFSVFSFLAPCFLWEGGPKIFFASKFFFVSFYIHMWFHKKLFENFLSFGWNLIPILVKSEKSFNKSFLFKIEICPKYPLRFWVANCFRIRGNQNPFIFWPFGDIRTQINIDLLGSNFFPPCSLTACTICIFVRKFL